MAGGFDDIAVRPLGTGEGDGVHRCRGSNVHRSRWRRRSASSGGNLSQGGGASTSVRHPAEHRRKRCLVAVLFGSPVADDRVRVGGGDGSRPRRYRRGRRGAARDDVVQRAGNRLSVPLGRLPASTTTDDGRSRGRHRRGRRCAVKLEGAPRRSLALGDSRSRRRRAAAADAAAVGKGDGVAAAAATFCAAVAEAPPPLVRLRLCWYAWSSEMRPPRCAHLHRSVACQWFLMA